jgi:hypothetical protein
MINLLPIRGLENVLPSSLPLLDTTLHVVDQLVDNSLALIPFVPTLPACVEGLGFLHGSGFP